MAFIFYWLWVNIINQTPLAFPYTEILPSLVIPSRLGSIFVGILTYLVLSFWFKHSNTVIRQNWYLAFLAILMFTGSLASVFWSEVAPYVLPGSASASDISAADKIAPALVFVLYLIASLLIGVSSACLCIETQRVFGHLGSQYVLFIGCFSVLVSSVIILALSHSLWAAAHCFAQQLQRVLFSRAQRPTPYTL
ncbi:MAG: hypothetical protein LBP24_00820 [Coriobacteriales bacterium]|nr:hypothetical protein [Coriobacteriales bacterium]